MKWVQKDIIEHHTYYSTWELVLAMLAASATTAVVLLVVVL
jgi:hypothetical protein